MLNIIFKTTNSYNWLLLRMALGVVMLGHGLQKSLGWFGGFGWNGSMHYFTDFVGLPSVLAAFIILIESVGAVFLILGAGGRIMAALMGIVIVGALIVDHSAHGFFMNWLNTQKGEGIEFDILFLSIAIVLSVNGSGKFSIDQWLYKKWEKKTGPKNIIPQQMARA